MKKRNKRPPIRAAVDTARMESIERWGDDVETAVKMALEELQLTEDQVTVEVLEEPSKGFFGIGAKLAKVKVTRKETLPKEEKQEKKEKSWGPIRKEEVTEEEKAGLGASKKNDRGPRKGGKNNRNNNKGRNEKAENAEVEVGGLEEPVVPVVDRESLTALPQDNEGLVFLKNMISEMGLDVETVGMTDGTDLYFFIEGKDSGTIIGKRGATLDAIQYIASLVVNKGEGEYIRVVVDAENYRAKREKSLEKLAMRLADKVAKTGRSYKLEPMNPYERKVIHATLQKDSRVTTKSEGQDPSRRVLIEAK